MLFRSLTDDEYILGTVVDKATVPCSYIIEAQGKCYHRTREHLRPIHINLPSPVTHKPQPPSPKYLQPASLSQIYIQNTFPTTKFKCCPYLMSPVPFLGPCSPLSLPLLLMLPLQLINYFDTYPPLTPPPVLVKHHSNSRYPQDLIQH